MRPTNAELKSLLMDCTSTIVDQGVTISDYIDEVSTLKAHIRESRDLTDADLIASLRKELLRAGQESKHYQHRSLYLAGKLKTARADGVQEMVNFDISFATPEILSYLEELRDRQ